MNVIKFISILLLAASAYAQVINGGSHEVPKDEAVRIPKHLRDIKDILVPEVPTEHETVGLKGENSELQVTILDIHKIDEIYKTINALKAADIGCAKKLGTKTLFKNTKTIEDVLNRLSVVFYTDKITTGMSKTEIKKCDCDKLSSKVLTCIKEDVGLSKKMQNSFLNESDLKHLLDIIYLEKNVLDHKTIKQLVLDIYGE